MLMHGQDPAATGTLNQQPVDIKYKHCCYNSQVLAGKIFSALGGRQLNSHEWMLHCCCHDDKNPSLHMSLSGDKILLCCHAGCSQSEIIEELRNRGLWPERKQEHYHYQQDIPVQWREGNLVFSLVEKYRYYHPIEKKLLGIIGRYENENGQKRVIPFFEKQNERWKAGLGKWKSEKKLWYGLEKISNNTKLLVLEGEKCVETFRSLNISGWTAVCWQGGSKAAARADFDMLANILVKNKISEIYLWPDCDKTGVEAMEQIYCGLKKLNLKIYLIDPKILRYPEGYDLADIAKNVNILQYIRDNKELVSKQTFQKHKILCEIYNLQNLDEQELANIYQKVNEQIITKWTQYFELLYALLLKEKVTIFRKYDYTFISLSALKVEYQNWPCYLYSGRITAKGKIEITRKKKNPVELWLESPDRKEYYSIGFRDNHKMLGLFHGWPYRPKQGKCDNFINFVHEIICSGNDQYTEWLLDWIAHIIQKPENKDEVSTSIVLRGSKRLGKSFFSRKLMDLIGFDPMNPNKSFALKINSNLQLTGRFNFHLAWKLLVIAEELKWDGRGEGVLKDIIDTPFLTVEPKWRDIYAMPNLMRLIILSNENWIVPATMDESRFFVLDVSEKRKEDIPLLVDHFISHFNKIQNKNIKGVSPEALSLLMAYDWPGNIRELQNAIERAVITSKNTVINEDSFGFRLLFCIGRENKIPFFERKKCYSCKRKR